MKKSQFIALVRKVVAEEVRNQLPQVMSEMYIKKLVKESNVNNGPADEEYEDYGDYIPQPLNNSTKGIYDNGAEFFQKENALLSPDNPFSTMYEDISKQKRVESKKPVGVPLPFDFKKMSKISNMLNETSSERTPIKKSAESEMRRIEMLRKQLDEK